MLFSYLPSSMYRVVSCHEGRSSRSADGLDVVVLKDDAFPGQPVQVWRLDVLVVPWHVVVACENYLRNKSW